MTLRIMTQLPGHRGITTVNHEVTVEMLQKTSDNISWLDLMGQSLAKDRSKIVDLVDNYGKIVRRYSNC